jgi:hypothetical protein
MEAKDLTALSPKVFAMPVGGLARWTQNTLVAEPVPSADVTRTQPSIEEHKETPPLDSAVSSARAFCSRLRRHYFGLTFWIGKLKVHLPEYNGVLHLSAWKVRFIPGEDKADIRVSAGALCNWLSKRYGTDGLYVGGHFSVVSADTSRIRRFLLACMLVENRLDPLSMLAQLCAGGGFKFLVNRREEILSVVARRKFSPGIGARE